MDPDLLARLERRSRGHPAALAVVRGEAVEVVEHACPENASFEIGSISKGITGLLYTDAIARGEVAADTPLGELLPLPDGPLRTVTLSALARHRSGLPRTVGGHVVRRSLDLLRHGTDPYDQPVTEFLADAAQARLGPPRPRYSNAGFQLLGHALAAAAGTSYSDLVHGRIAGPLGLAPFYATRSAADLPAGALPGHAGRRVVDPWASEALAPAGGVRASIGAMAGLVSALLSGTAPGAAALDPVADFAGPGMRIGAGWLVAERGRSGVLTWHNGGTGGFRSWVGLRRDRGIGVVVLSSVARSVDGLGLGTLVAAS